MMVTRALITGAGGFIGGHLGKFLRKKGCWVRGADIKEPEFMLKEEIADEFLIMDLKRFENCLKAVSGVDEVYSLAANMGGIGFITQVKAEVMRDNVLLNTNILESARIKGVKRLFYSSSACVYPTYLQKETDVTPLKESDAYPADPDNEYGWEKLFSERMYMNFAHDFGMQTRIARFHNTYGPYGTWTGGREKAPAAICRKIAEAEDGGVIEIWGDGKQTRSYNYIDDCIEGIYKLMRSDYPNPVNIGSDRLITVDEMIDIILRISGKKLRRKYDTSKPQGVRGRNSDNTLAQKILGWSPKVSLEEGLKITYHWIAEQVKKQKQLHDPAF